MEKKASKKVCQAHIDMMKPFRDHSIGNLELSASSSILSRIIQYISAVISDAKLTVTDFNLKLERDR